MAWRRRTAQLRFTAMEGRKSMAAHHCIKKARSLSRAAPRVLQDQQTRLRLGCDGLARSKSWLHEKGRPRGLQNRTVEQEVSPCYGLGELGVATDLGTLGTQRTKCTATPPDTPTHDSSTGPQSGQAAEGSAASQITIRSRSLNRFTQYHK